MDPTAPRRRTRPAGGASVAQRPAQRRHVSGPAPAAGAAEPGIGDLLGSRYRIDSQLGYGGMAHVYRARDELLQRDVAIKVFRSNVSEAVDPQRTTREMHILASLSHPAVVSVLDASDDPLSGAYIVMELVDGDDLGTLLRAGPVAPEQARRIAADVASALDALHGRSIVHRDVKPANILVLSDAAAASGGVAAKLTDFGIAQLIDGTRITGPESILGTAAFLSPEQVRSERVGPAADIYSLGLVLLECLTGERVFPGNGVETAVARLARAPAIPASASPGLADLLRRMTAMDPAGRPTAGEVAEQLREQLVGGMLAGEATRTAETPAIPMTVVAAASMPLATGPVRAAGAAPTGSVAPFGTGGVGTVFPDAVGAEPEDPAGRRRRLVMLSALIGGFAALTATAAIVLALLPAPVARIAPVQQQTGAGPASASAPAGSGAVGSSGSSPANGGSTASGSSRASSTASASSGSSGSATATSTDGASSSPTASSSTPSSSSTPTGAASSSSSSSSTATSSSPTSTASTEPTGGTTSSPSDSPSPSSPGPTASSLPTTTLGVSTGDATDGAGR